MCFNRWVFVARLERLYAERAERDKLLSRTRQLLSQQQATRVAALLDQLRELKDENYKTQRALADTQLELVATRRRFDMKALEGKDQTEEIKNLRDALTQAEQRQRQVAIEHLQLTNALSSAEAYATSLDQDLKDI